MVDEKDLISRTQINQLISLDETSGDDDNGGNVLEKYVGRYFFDYNGQYVTYVKNLFKESMGVCINMSLTSKLINMINKQCAECSFYINLSKTKIVIEDNMVDDNDEMVVYSDIPLNINCKEFSMANEYYGDIVKNIYELFQSKAIDIVRHIDSKLTKHIVKIARQDFIEKNKNRGFMNVLGSSLKNACSVKNGYSFVIASGHILSQFEEQGTDYLLRESDNMEFVYYTGQFERVAASVDAIVYSFRWNFSELGVGSKKRFNVIKPHVVSIGDIFSNNGTLDPVNFWGEIHHSHISCEDWLRLLRSLPDNFHEILPIQIFANDVVTNGGYIGNWNIYNSMGLSPVEKDKFGMLLRSTVCLENLVALHTMGGELPFDFYCAKPCIKNTRHGVVYVNTGGILTNSYLKVSATNLDFNFQIDDEDDVCARIVDSFKVSHAEGIYECIKYDVVDDLTSVTSSENIYYEMLGKPELSSSNVGKKFYLMLSRCKDFESCSQINLVPRHEHEYIPIMEHYQRLFKIKDGETNFPNETLNYLYGGVNSILRKNYSALPLLRR